MLASSLRASTVTRTPVQLQQAEWLLTGQALPAAHGGDNPCCLNNPVAPACQHPGCPLKAGPCKPQGLSTASPCPCLRLRKCCVDGPESLLARKHSKLVRFGAAGHRTL